jgi:hypothetical protein
MRALTLYDSLGGNTQKVAEAIYETLKGEGLSSQMVQTRKDTDIDFLDYDLIFAGSPVISWLPTKAMMNFIQNKMKSDNEKGLIKPAAPIIPGKFCVCFCTFAGPHIGKREARPLTMWLRSAFEHYGFIVLDTWHIVGEFKNRDDLTKNGRLGNIEGRPDEHDLLSVKNRVKGVIASLEAWNT